MAKRKYKVYTDVQKLEALDLADKIGRNKAAATVGVPASTISTWRKDYAVIEKNANAYMVEAVEKKVDLSTTNKERLDSWETDFIQLAIDVEKAAMERMKKTIPKANLRDVAGALKIVRETTRPKEQNTNIQVNNFNQFVDSLEDQYRKL